MGIYDYSVPQVSGEELRSTVAKYNTQKAQLQTAYLQMSNAVRTVDGSWNGDASEAFKAQFDQLYKNIEQTEALDLSLLDRSEIEWLNAYHERVYRTLSPQLPREIADWLREKTLAIQV